jgi:hypothetical protein
VFQRRPFIAWLIVYTALGVAVTFPLMLHLGTTIAGDLGDPLFITSVLWWNAHVVPLTERWWNGFAFFPVTGMLAFSDHLLGESLIAAPLQWLGCTPATAYNLLLLATFPLCAIAAHALGFVLTRRHDAAALCGLAYGFNPYRIAHISHVKLLAAFGMPAALAALHLMADTGRRRWTVVFATALIVQALCTGYYIAFFAVLLFLWVLWFVRWRDGWRLLLSMAAAAAGLAVVVSPLAIGYARIHRQYGMAHNIGEVLAFSADITSLVTATSRSALWFWTSTLNGGEGQIFPGLVMAVLVFGGVFVAVRRRTVARDGLDRLSFGLAGVAAAYFMVAVCARYFGPWHIQLGPLKIGADVFFKPMSVALAAAALAVATSSRARDAWKRRSLLAFYVIATVVLFICSFGPKPTFLGRQVLYEPPYAWLMHLPVFSTEIRAPARFAMLAILTLSVAGALVFDRLRASAQGASTRRVVFAALMLCVLADGWPREFPMPALPDLLPAHRADGFEAVLELPLGDSDQSAMYRATVHQHPVVNGASGFLPSNYEALMGAVRGRDGSVLDAVAATGHILVAVDSREDPDHFWSTALRTRPGTASLGDEGAWSFFTMEPSPRQRLCESGLLPIVRAAGNQGDVDLKTVTDNDPATSWRRPTQQAGDALVLDLGQPASPCALRLSVGQAAFAFPRALSIATSVDGLAWTNVFEGSTGGEAVRAALAQPTNAWLEFVLPPGEARGVRFIRLRIEASRPDVPWQVSDIMIRGSVR